MRRRLLAIAVFLLIGAAINVAVAWGCGLWTWPGRMHDIPDPPGVGWPARVPKGWPDAGQESRSAYVGLGLTMTLASDAPDLGNLRGRVDPALPDHSMTVYDFGIPVRSMRITHRVDQNFKRIATSDLEWGLELLPRRKWTGSFNAYTQRLVPLAPIWIGFAFNTLLFALIAWLVLLWATRLRRGLCVGCAYDVRGLDTCPECGSEAMQTKAKGS